MPSSCRIALLCLEDLVDLFLTARVASFSVTPFWIACSNSGVSSLTRPIPMELEAKAVPLSLATGGSNVFIEIELLFRRLAGTCPPVSVRSSSDVLCLLRGFLPDWKVWRVVSAENMMGKGARQPERKHLTIGGEVLACQ